MKKTKNYGYFSFQEKDILNEHALNSVKGGNADNEEYEIIYIDGVPYLVRRNSIGQIIEILAA